MSYSRRRSDAREHLTDRQLLLLINERLDQHLDEHAWWTGAYRWAMVTLLTAATAVGAWVRWH